MLVVLGKSWLPGCNSLSSGVTRSGVHLHLGCQQCLGQLECMPLVVTVPRLLVGADLEEGLLVHRWCVLGFRHAGLFFQHGQPISFPPPPTG